MVNNEKFQELLRQLERERDELVVKLGLAKLDARDDWREMQKKLDQLRGRMKAVAEESREQSEDVGVAAEVLAEQIKESFRKIRDTM